MLIVEPDYDRRIDLPGAGPCPRPVDIDANKVRLDRLVSLRVYAFARGIAIDGEAEEDEVFIVLMRGAADFAIRQGEVPVGTFGLRAGGGPRAIYMPPHAAYRLDAVGDCAIAYARCRPANDDLPDARDFASETGRLDVIGYATGMDLTLLSGATGTVHGLSRDGTAPQRFVHVRAGGDGVALVADRRLGDWQSAVLDEGEAALIETEGDDVEVLVISAR